MVTCQSKFNNIKEGSKWLLRHSVYESNCPEAETSPVSVYLKPSHVFEANKQAYADHHPQLGKKNRAMKLRNTISHFISWKTDVSLQHILTFRKHNYFSVKCKFGSKKKVMWAHTNSLIKPVVYFRTTIKVRRVFKAKNYSPFSIMSVTV